MFLYLCVVANGVLRAHYNTYVFTMIIEATCIVFVIVLFVFVWLSVYQLAAHLRALAAAASPGVREIDISGYYKFLALGNALFVVVIVFLILSLANNIANVHCLSCVPYYEKQVRTTKVWSNTESPQRHRLQFPLLICISDPARLCRFV